MNIFESKNTDALDILVDLIDPVANIMADAELREVSQNGGKKIDAVKVAIKNHKEEVIQILAVIDGIPVEKANYSLMDIITKALAILNDKELVNFFTLQGQTEEKTSSIPVTETTKARKK